MRELWYFVLLSIFVQAISDQAPGDEDDCFTLIGRPSFANQIVLMSSRNYRNLVESAGGPWIVVDRDNNNNGLSTTWTESGSTCARVISVCGFATGPQDNWLITQFINNIRRRSEIYIKVVFSINSDQCTTGCQTTLDMRVLQTSISNQSFVGDVSVFNPPAQAFVLTSSIRDGQNLIQRVQTLSANLDTTGFYVALRDTGTCTGVSEVTVFYPVCDGISLDFGANFAETRFPGETSSGTCFENMSINVDTPNEPFDATCILEILQNDGSMPTDVITNWTISGGPSGCMCLPGYEFISRATTSQCQACQPFTFKNTLSNDVRCRPCPMFSNSSDEATAVCPCDSEYFRPLDGSEDAMPCTRPPSPPRSITYSDVTNTSVFIMWEASIDNGSRTDLVYTISQNVTDDDNVTTPNTSIMLMGLIPFVHYEITVTADNGVSSQDGNEEDRTLSIFIMTLEGVGGVIDNSTFHDINGLRLTWDPPMFPQGTIMHYEVRANGSNVLRTFRTGSTEFIANNHGLSPGVYCIQVRAVTSQGPGQYTDCFTFVVMPPPDDGGDSTNLGPIIGAAVGGVVVVLIIICIIIIVVILVYKQRSGKHNVHDATMQYTPQGDEDIVKKLPGIRKYVDPQNYASPDAALKDFAHEIPSHQLRLDEVIGGGEFGDVCRGIWYKPSSKHLSVAIKTLKPGSPYKDRVDFLTEASIMGQFHHPNVITLHGVVTKSQPVMIVMEYMENKSLDFYLRKNDDLLGPKRLVTMAQGVAAGMQYFGEIGFVHRDLAARNVLVSKEEVCKIADFGLSRETVDNAYDVKTGGKIPIRWTAPEAIQYRKFTTSSDVWSYGVLLWEVMSYGQQPYWDWSNHKVLDEVEAGYRLEIPKDCPQTVYQVMLDCWNLDHRLRPKFDEIGKELETLLQNNFRSSRSIANNQIIQSSVCPLDYDSIDKWLNAIKMDRYIENFRQSGLLQPRDCITLTHTTLMEMGITLSGHQHKILSSIQTANSRLQREPSYKI